LEIAIYFLAVIITALVISFYFLGQRLKSEKRKNEKLLMLVEAGDLYSVIWSTDFTFIEANKKLSNRLSSVGEKPDESFLRSIFVENDSLGTTGSVLLMSALSKNGRYAQLKLPDGSSEQILWRSKIVSKEETATVIATVGINTTDEFSVKEQLNEALHQKAVMGEYLDIAEESAYIGMLSVIQTGQGYKLSLSKNGLVMLNSSNGELTFDSFLEMLSQRGKNLFKDTIDKLFAGKKETENFELGIKLSGNIAHRFAFRMKAINNCEGNLNRITAAFIDLTGTRRNIMLRDRSHSEDALTGFLDRNSFFAGGITYLEAKKEENEAVVIFSIRVDRFRKISTLFGMEIADQLLMVYAQGIESCAGKDSLFGKIDLDSFAVIMPCENRERADLFIKNLLLYVENACNGKILPKILTEQSRFTAGACFYDGIDDIVTLYNKANMMLLSEYDDPNLNCHYFDKAVEEKIFNRDILEQELRDAIVNGEFVLYYQPKVRFDNGEIYGAEALIRWEHPKNGLVSPATFIPVAEEAGLITKIDEWGLIQACRQGKQWQDKGYRAIRISVNMSQAQLYQTDVVYSIKRALAESGIEPRYIEVELTETMAMQDIDRTISILKEIKTLGVSISMDDFGTGYSSLSSLKILPIDILKIDRSLICDITTSDTARNIVKAIVELGKALNLEILAEGVEDEEQSALLFELGCHIAQGYYYGRPISASDMERLFLGNTVANEETV